MQFTAQIEQAQDKITILFYFLFCLTSLIAFYQLHHDCHYQTNCRLRGRAHITCDKLIRLLGSCVSRDTLTPEMGYQSFNN